MSTYRPRAVVSYQAVHGVPEPDPLPWLPNDGWNKFQGKQAAQSIYQRQLRNSILHFAILQQTSPSNTCLVIIREMKDATVVFIRLSYESKSEKVYA